MGKRVVVETGRDRRDLVADAGWKQISLGSLLAGVLVAYGGFAILAGIAGGILEATDADADITARWGDLGVGAGLVVAGLLFFAYLYGGYVAGRMARRAGVLHGVGVFVLGLLIVAAVAVIVRQVAGTEAVVDRLRDMGLPTTGDEWSDVGTVGGLASLLAALAGAVIGGILGERWHAKLLSRAIDPEIGAEADARRQASQLAAEAQVRNTSAQARVDNASLRHRDRTAVVEEPAPTSGTVTRDGAIDRDRTDDAVVERGRPHRHRGATLDLASPADDPACAAADQDVRREHVVDALDGALRVGEMRAGGEDDGEIDRPVELCGDRRRRLESARMRIGGGGQPARYAHRHRVVGP